MKKFSLLPLLLSFCLVFSVAASSLAAETATCYN